MVDQLAELLWRTRIRIAVGLRIPTALNHLACFCFPTYFDLNFWIPLKIDYVSFFPYTCNLSNTIILLFVKFLPLRNKGQPRFYFNMAHLTDILTNSEFDFRFHVDFSKVLFLKTPPPFLSHSTV